MSTGLSLSVIVPVYKAEHFIQKNLRTFQSSVKKLVPRVVDRVELIAVIDGYVDRSRTEASKVKGVKVVGYSRNQGKGHALKVGYAHASGNVVTFLDADGDFNPDQIINFFPYLATADIVVGSKRHPFSKIEYPLIRKIFSNGFRCVSKIILGIGLRDTQSGLKLIKKQVLDVIMPSLVIKRYAFDVELCFLAQVHGFRTVEAPVCIEFKGDSTIGVGAPYGLAFKMFKDVLAIRYRYSVKKYYQKKYHEAHFPFLAVKGE